jgi:hypothetical protein
LAYGAINSGKSYTMIGDSNSGSPGILSRAVHDLFKQVDSVQNQDASTMFHVEVSFVEIYNNKIRNLLKSSGDSEKIEVHESQNLGVFMTGANLNHAVTTHEEAVSLVSSGLKARAVRNHHKHVSSRSHIILTFKIERREFRGVPGEKAALTIGTLQIVDLAGIEKLTTSSEAHEYMEENKNINTSLNSLGEQSYLRLHTLIVIAD